MKVPLLILAIFLLLLMVSAVAQSNAPTPAQAGAPSATAGGRFSGGSYRLTSVAGGASFWSVGGDYRLHWGSTVAPAALPDQGAGCCCTYLPCVPNRSP